MAVWSESGQHLFYFGRYISLAGQAWRRHPVRTFLSSVGIVCGVSAVVAMLAIGEGARRQTLYQIGQLGLNNIIVRAPDSSVMTTLEDKSWQERGLGAEDRRILEGLGIFEKIAAAKGLSCSVTELSSTFSAEILATGPEFARIYNFIMAEGRFLHLEDVQHGSRVCVIGADVAKGLGVYSELGRTVSLMGEVFTVIGRIAPMSWSASKVGGVQLRNINACVFVPLWSSMEQGYAEIVARVRPGNDVIGAGALVERVLSVTRQGVKPAHVVVPLALVRQAEESQRLFNWVLGSIAAISLLVGGIGIMNIMLANVAERTPEIGLRRAVGATRQDILIQFVVEAVLIGFIGGLAGFCLGCVGAFMISAAADWPTAISWWVAVLPMAMSLSVTGLAAFYPAWLASRIDPIAALRQSYW